MLCPDILVEFENGATVLDTKWKILDSSALTGSEKYGLSQADFYQMFAYGQRYSGGNGDMLLIFPASSAFQRPLPPFHFSEDLRLWAVPFDIDQGQLVDGDWSARAEWFSVARRQRAA